MGEFVIADIMLVFRSGGGISGLESVDTALRIGGLGVLSECTSLPGDSFASLRPCKSWSSGVGSRFVRLLRFLLTEELLEFAVEKEVRCSLLSRPLSILCATPITFCMGFSCASLGNAVGPVAP